MSIEDYRYAEELIEQNEELSDFVGACPSELIEKAEHKLGVKFPDSYREFLLRYGAGSFGSEEIYGVIKDDFDNSGIPDAVWYTLKQRKEVELPEDLIIIYSTGGEGMFCLNLGGNHISREAPVVSYMIGHEPAAQKYEVIADDFGIFLLQLIKKELLNN